MSKILIIGVGSAGINTVKHMKEVGIPNANHITFGGYKHHESDIPHYNLITMNGFDSIPVGSDSKEWRNLAENAKESISEIIAKHLNLDNND